MQINLLQTHLESQIHPLSVMMGTHQRFLEASLRGDKSPHLNHLEAILSYTFMVERCSIPSNA